MICMPNWDELAEKIRAGRPIPIGDTLQDIFDDISHSKVELDVLLGLRGEGGVSVEDALSNLERIEKDISNLPYYSDLDLLKEYQDNVAVLRFGYMRQKTLLHGTPDLNGLFTTSWNGEWKDGKLTIILSLWIALYNQLINDREFREKAREITRGIEGKLDKFDDETAVEESDETAPEEQEQAPTAYDEAQAKVSLEEQREEIKKIDDATAPQPVQPKGKRLKGGKREWGGEDG